MQALGDPNDPAAAFAQDFLGSVMSGLPMPQARPAATRDAREATLALLDETFATPRAIRATPCCWLRGWTLASGQNRSAAALTLDAAMQKAAA